MKITGLSALAMILLTLVSFVPRKQEKIRIKSLDMEFVQVSEGIYMSTTEVSNFQYLDFLYSLCEEEKKEKCLQYYPDTTLWRTPFSYGEPYVHYYFRHPAYRNYPVVTIDVNDAKAFCTWLTGKLQQEKKLAGKGLTAGLPTEAEWYAALGGNDAALKPERTPKGEHNYNLKTKPVNVAANLNDASTITAPVKSFYPNELGLYNMIGNVAELTAEGYVKGGSWNDEYNDVKPEARQKLEVPGPQVGFRVVLRVE